jgi:pimeloyl-ACP methyl ester carboxylesterase
VGLSQVLRDLGEHFETQVLPLPAEGPQDYAALQDRLEPQLPAGDAPYALVAESFCGPLALRLAAREPRGLSAVVLINSFVVTPVGLARGLAAALAAPLLSRLATARRLAALPMLGAGAPDALARELADAVARLPPATLAARLRTVAAANETAAYLTTQVPIFYLRGQQDRLVGERAVQSLIQLRPGLQLQRIDGPHLLLQREPARCAEALTRMLLQRA